MCGLESWTWCRGFRGCCVSVKSFGGQRECCKVLTINCSQRQFSSSDHTGSGKRRDQGSNRVSFPRRRRRGRRQDRGNLGQTIVGGGTNRGPRGPQVPEKSDQRCVAPERGLFRDLDSGCTEFAYCGTSTIQAAVAEPFQEVQGDCAKDAFPSREAIPFRCCAFHVYSVVGGILIQKLITFLFFRLNGMSESTTSSSKSSIKRFNLVSNGFLRSTSTRAATTSSSEASTSASAGSTWTFPRNLTASCDPMRQRSAVSLTTNATRFSHRQATMGRSRFSMGWCTTISCRTR